MRKFIIFIFLFLILMMPSFSLVRAQEGWPGLVPCSNTPDNGNISPSDLCDFDAFMKLINIVINFILFYMAMPIAAIMFFYAGFKLVTSGGNSEARGKAKNIFTNAVIGLVLAVGAWLIIKTILSILYYKDIGTFFLI